MTRAIGRNRASSTAQNGVIMSTAQFAPPHLTDSGVIKDTSIGFFVVAGIQGGIGVFIAPSLIIDAVLIAVPALILVGWKARAAEVLLLILASIIAITTFLNKAGVISEGSSNISCAYRALGMGTCD
ncbi:MAG: hypothetical protein WHS46_14810 [Desulfosoma sp.]